MKRIVLVAEDNAIDRSILVNILKGTYEVIEATTGREAIKLFNENSEKISALVVDIYMPDLNGFDFIKTITNENNWRQIPIIVASAERDVKKQEESIKLGAVGFVEKPYNRTILLHIVKNSIAIFEMAALANSIKRDELTGLLNRQGFLEAAQPLIDSAPKGHYTITVVNLDNFKLINDQFGTAAGDRLLKLAAKILEESLQEPGDEGFVGRLNSDKFVILSLTSGLNSTRREKYHHALRHPDFLPQRITFRVGRCVVNDLSVSLNTYIDHAYMAEQSMKDGYGEFIAFYDDKMMKELQRKQKIVSQMVDALANKEFQPYFQPQFNHQTGELIGAEALVRWIQNGKIIPPDEFVPIFEQNGFIYEMDRYIWEEVCKNLRRWIDEGKNPPPVSVNVSRHDLLHASCEQTLLCLLKTYSIPMYLLRLEITESAFSGDSPFLKKIQRLIEKGFTVEIDDFGSGYSSLNALKDIKASVLKLDMRFFERCVDEKRAGTIVQFSVRLAKWLQMDVIAEGVETSDVAEYLKSIGCFFIQGFLYSKPIPLSEYEALLKKGKLTKPAQSTSKPQFQVADLSDPSSFDAWIYRSKAGAACILEIKNENVEVLRVNDAYIEALTKIQVSVKDVLEINWMKYFDERSKSIWPLIDKRLMANELDVEADLVFLNMPNCPPKVTIRTKQTLLGKGPDSVMVYCAVEFL